MKSATLLLILPVIGLTSCMAAQAVTNGNGTNVPVKSSAPAVGKRIYNSRGFIVEYPTEIPKAQTISPAIPPKNGDKTPEEPKKSFFSSPKPKASLPPAIGPKPVVAQTAPAPKVTTPPTEPRKPFFSFLKPKPSLPPAVGPKPVVAQTAPAPIVATPPIAPKASFFSFLKPKDSLSPAIGPKSVAARTAPAPNVAPPPTAPKKSFFSFLKPKDPPKAIVIGEVLAPKKSTQKSLETETPLDLPKGPKSDDGGLRLPDMLTMPGKGEFESTNPASPKTGGGAGVVTVRPPTDPPSRPKPKEKTVEP